MKTLRELESRSITVLLTDIDGTLTDNGRLPPHSYESLWRLKKSGLHVIPVTGRPAGWCELIARLWPVDGVVGENGAFYFRLEKKMKRWFARNQKQRQEDRKKLKAVREDVLRHIPGSGIASDQFCRLFDLAIDFSEDVSALNADAVQRIVSTFKKHGANAKVSNIHVNGWYGEYDKLSTCQLYLKNEFEFTPEQMKERCAFIGDSPNDEPMFRFFPNSVAVSNIKEFLPQLKSPPGYLTEGAEADGFKELADHLLAFDRS